MNVPHLLDFLEASLSGKALDKARRNQGRTDWTGVQTQYSEKWSLFWSVAALKTVVYPFHFISFLTHQIARLACCVALVGVSAACAIEEGLLVDAALCASFVRTIESLPW